MIDVIVSNSSCPHCDAQRVIMQKSFFPDEYRIITTGTAEFDGLDLKDKVDAVPFIVVRDTEDGSVKYAQKGKLDGTSLRQIERLGELATEEKVFNLREVRSAHSMSRYGG